MFYRMWIKVSREKQLKEWAKKFGLSGYPEFAAFDIYIDVQGYQTYYFAVIPYCISTIQYGSSVYLFTPTKIDLNCNTAGI